MVMLIAIFEEISTVIVILALKGEDRFYLQSLNGSCLSYPWNFQDYYFEFYVKFVYLSFDCLADSLNWFPLRYIRKILWHPFVFLILVSCERDYFSHFLCRLYILKWRIQLYGSFFICKVRVYGSKLFWVFSEVRSRLIRIWLLQLRLLAKRTKKSRLFSNKQYSFRLI